MSFLDHFTDAQRVRFESAGQGLRLTKGKFLMRRGEAGGDLFLLRDGKLEVVDTRSVPEVILAVLTPGVIIGEQSFLDGSPRSADVRASNDVEVLQWPRQDLTALLARHPDLAAEFYKAVATVTTERMRTVSDSAMASAYSRPKGPSSVGLGRARDDARTIADAAKEGFLEVETRLRHDPSDTAAHGALTKLLDRLQEELASFALANPEPGARDEAARVLGRELHPYLVRSSLAERCIRRPQGLTATAEILAHVYVDTPGGDGQLGELLDRWLLDRPTLKALRDVREPLLDLVAERLPTHRNRRVLLLNAGTGSLVAGLVERLDQAPTVLTVVDQSRDALEFLDASVLPASHVELVPVQENLAQFALGRRRTNLFQQDVVIVHGFVEYLPSRLVVSMLRAIGRLLVHGGTVVVSALGPSPDEVILDRLLAWPTIRRTADELARLFEAGWVDLEGEVSVKAPGQVLYGAPDPVMTARSTYTPAVAPRRTAQ